MDCSTPGLPVHHQLSEFTQNHLHWVGDAIQPSHPLLSPSPPAFNFSQHQGFSNESALCIRWPKYWSFSFKISPSNEHSGLISFRMDWLDLLAVQETLRSLLQHHSSKASILWCLTFFYDPTLYVYTLKQKSQQYYVISTIIIISILLHSDSEQFPMSLYNTRRSMILENLTEWLFQVKQ